MSDKINRGEITIDELDESLIKDIESSSVHISDSINTEETNSNIWIKPMNNSPITSLPDDPNYNDPIDIKIHDCNENAHEPIRKLVDNLRQEITPSRYNADVEIPGGTLINLLGRSGNAIYKHDTLMNEYNNVSDVTYDNEWFVYNNNSNMTSDRHSSLYVNNLKANKCYVILADIYQRSLDFVSHFSLEVLGSEVTDTKNQWLPTHSLTAFKMSDTVSNETKRILFRYADTEPNLNGCKIKNIRIYEISEEFYNKINEDSEFTGEELVKKIPYVDDVKPIINPTIYNKENSLQCVKWNYYDDRSDSIVTDGNSTRIGAILDVKENTPYTISKFFKEDTVMRIGFCDEDGLYSSMGIGYQVQDFTFTTPLGCKKIIVFVQNRIVDTKIPLHVVNNLRNGIYHMVLVEGSTPKSYEECNNSRIKFETTLYNGETINKDANGEYVKTTLWKEYQVSSNLNYTLLLSSPGHKCVISDDAIIHDCDDINRFGVRYDGKIIRYDGILNPEFDSDGFIIYSDSSFYKKGRIAFMFPNKLTGWGEDYTPSQEEIKAFFLGYMMYHYNGTENIVYNDTSGLLQKSWAKIWNGIGDKAYIGNNAVIANSSYTTCPTTLNDQGYTPYKLVYKLNKPIIEKIYPKGSLEMSTNNNIIATSEFEEGHGFYGKINVFPTIIKPQKPKDIIDKHTKEISYLGDIANKSLQQTSSITVTVGDGGDFGTINDAIEYLSNKYPQYSNQTKPLSLATIKLLHGFIMREQVHVYNMNLGWINIIGEDDETTIDRSYLIRNLAGRYPAFGAYQGSLPKISQLFNMDDSGDGNSRDGVLVYLNSSVVIGNNSGFKNVKGVALYASNHAKILSYESIATNSFIGILADVSSSVVASYVDVSNSLLHSIHATNNSSVSAIYGKANNNGVLYHEHTHAIYALKNSFIQFSHGEANNANGAALSAIDCSRIEAYSSTIKNAKSTGVFASHNSNIIAGLSDASGAFRYGIHAVHGSSIDINDATINDIGEDDNSRAILIEVSSKVNFRRSKALNCKGYGAYVVSGSSLVADSSDFSGAKGVGLYAGYDGNIYAHNTKVDNTGTPGAHCCGVYANTNSKITFSSGSVTNCTWHAICASNCSQIYADHVTANNSSSYGIIATGSSRIQADSADISGSSQYSVYSSEGSSVVITNSNARKGSTDSTTDIIVDYGGSIYAKDATGGVSQNINILTRNGIIYK